MTVTAYSTVDPTKTASAAVALNPSPAPPVRINAGGAQYVDGGGNVWAGDGTRYYCQGIGYGTGGGISGTPDQACSKRSVTTRAGSVMRC